MSSSPASPTAAAPPDASAARGASADGPSAGAAAPAQEAYQPNPNRWWTLVAVSLGTFMLLVDITIINVALPDIQKQLNASFSDLQWVIDAYALTLASLLLTTGSLADLYGRRKLYMLGLAVFTLASLLCGLSTSPLMLIMARGVQGIGGAVMFSVSLALLASAFSGRERGVAFGVWGAITGLAVAIGPLLGGALTSGLSWRWIFFVNLPLGLVAVLLTKAKVSESLQRGARRPDWAGFVSFTAALSLLVFALIRSGEKGWTSPQVLGSFAAAAVLLLVFVGLEMRGRHPMFDLSLFRLPTFVGGSLAAFSLSASLFAMQLYLVLYLQDVLGYSAFGTGLRLLVLSGGIILTSTVAGRLTSHVPVRFLIGPGLLLVGLGLLLMRRIDPTSDWSALIPGLFIAGVGTGLVNPPLASTAVGVVEPARSGMASGINSTFRQVGIATGIATFGSLFASAVTNQVSKAFAGAPPQVAANLSSAVKNGAGSQAIAALPEQLRASAAAIAKASFVFGLRQILLIAAVVALVGGVLGLLLVRGKDFVGAGAEAGAGAGPDAAKPGPGADVDGSADADASADVDGSADAGTAAPLARPEPVDSPAQAVEERREEPDPVLLDQSEPAPEHSEATLVHGVVTHTDDRPFEGVPMTITSGDGEPVAVVHTDHAGRFAVPVQPGSYIVIASPPGCQPDARRVLVPAGAIGETAEFVLDGDGLIYGRVRGATSGVVTLLNASGEVVARSDIEPNGGYELAGLRSGVYTAAVVVPGAAPAAHQIEVLPGDAREYDLGLGPADLSANYPDLNGEDPDLNGEDPDLDGDAGVADGAVPSPFSAGLHPVAMVRGGTGISGLPSAAGNGVAPRSHREED